MLSKEILNAVLALPGCEVKDDMPANIKSALTNNQLTLSFKNQKLMLGTWQGLYLFEHRLKQHTRTLSHHLIGD